VLAGPAPDPRHLDHLRRNPAHSAPRARTHQDRHLTGPAGPADHAFPQVYSQIRGPSDYISCGTRVIPQTPELALATRRIAGMRPADGGAKDLWCRCGAPRWRAARLGAGVPA
jgi:hypothetical protein